MEAQDNHGPLPVDDMKKYRNSVARMNNAPRYEKPKWFDEELTSFRGCDPLTGKPRYRCVFGQDPETMVFRCGKWRFKYVLGVAHQDIRKSLRGLPITVGGKTVYIETDLIGVEHLAEPVGLPYYFIEKLVTPAEMCSEEYWEKKIRWDTDIAHGRRDDVMGPYPRDGYYREFIRLVKHDLTPAPPSQKALDQVKALIVFKEEQEAELRQFTTEQQVKREMADDDAYQEELDEACRKDLQKAFMSIKNQILGHAVSFPGAHVGAGLNAR